MIDFTDEALVLKIARIYYLENQGRDDSYIEELEDEGPQLRVRVVSSDWGFDEYTVPKDIFRAKNPVKAARIQGLARRIKILSEDILISSALLKKQELELCNLSNQLDSITNES